MEETQPKTGKYALTYGNLSLGAIGVVFAFNVLLFGYALPRRNDGAALAFLLLLLLIVIGMLQF